MVEWRIPLADLELDETEVRAVAEVLRSRWLSMGPLTAEFERRFAAYLGVKHALAVSSGTAALHLAHLALGAGPGDRVLCPALTFVATANAICYSGAQPVFVDITSPDDLNLSPDDAAAKIDATTRGICVVHYGGYACDMERIGRLARAHGLYVVEDAAHAPGAACWVSDGEGTLVLKKCGSLGDVGCFSFFANKNLTTAEGGMLTTNSDAVAEKLRLLRSHGMTSLTWDRQQGHSFSYDVVALGFNYRLDELRAALGLVQLDRLEANNRRRQQVVAWYRQALAELPDIGVPFAGVTTPSAYHLMPVLLPPGVDRTRLMQHLRARGIQSSIHYPPIHRFAHYRRAAGQVHLPVTEAVAARLLTLPLYPAMRREDVQAVVAALRDGLAAA
ncbi:MAG: aminotransferase DegT [Candidatus Tectimicrobiota bacterium]|nr:MAG: aminotransferase DegT [Candidatus Tectomicrobia bacterium]